jgi:putative PIN family toxin of toxin-antitoxin system
LRLAVLDTNVVVSAGIQSRGPSARIVDSALDGQIVVVTCPSVVAEYLEVTNRPRLAKLGLPPEWLDFLVDQSFQRPEPAPWPISGPDPDDLVFLALAKASGAVLVTGNIADYPEAIRDGVTVLSPRDYWESLQQD